jgi:two-component SAPR family response regulator
MDKKYICSLIEAEMEKLKSRIVTLEQKDIDMNTNGVDFLKRLQSIKLDILILSIYIKSLIYLSG